MNFLTNEERLKYYMGKAYDNKFLIILNKDLYSKLIVYNSNINNRNIKVYCKDLYDYIKELKNYNEYIYLLVPGDIVTNYNSYILTKTRPINTYKNILLNVNYQRHWSSLNEVKKYDIPYELKNNKIIWRGVASGFNKRKYLVEKYYNTHNSNIDIGFSDLEQLNNNILKQRFKNTVKNYVSIKDMLKYKFIISVEGNDVASNLKWIMFSNSVVIMPPPTICSWFMEDKLIEWIHYIPVKVDFSNLEEILNWCLKNDNKCKEIAINGKLYTSQFLNIENESKISNELLIRYRENIIYQIKKQDNIFDFIKINDFINKKNIILK
jgi:hypothetical protein